MKFISEEDNRIFLNKIRNIGWENYKANTLNEDTNNEPIVIKIKGSISNYAKSNGCVNASEAMKIIKQTR